MDAAKIMDTKTADKVIVIEWNNTQKYWMSLNMIGGTIEIEEGVNRPTADKAGYFSFIHNNSYLKAS